MFPATLTVTLFSMPSNPWRVASAGERGHAVFTTRRPTIFELDASQLRQLCRAARAIAGGRTVWPRQRRVHRRAQRPPWHDDRRRGKELIRQTLLHVSANRELAARALGITVAPCNTSSRNTAFSRPPKIPTMRHEEIDRLGLGVILPPNISIRANSTAMVKSVRPFVKRSLLGLVMASRSLAGATVAGGYRLHLLMQRDR
jgi:hypothetical protein